MEENVRVHEYEVPLSVPGHRGRGKGQHHRDAGVSLMQLLFLIINL